MDIQLVVQRRNTEMLKESIRHAGAVRKSRLFENRFGNHTGFDELRARINDSKIFP